MYINNMRDIHAFRHAIKEELEPLLGKICWQLETIERQSLKERPETCNECKYFKEFPEEYAYCYYKPEYVQRRGDYPACHLGEKK
jgi:hypothetical protein